MNYQSWPPTNVLLLKHQLDQLAAAIRDRSIRPDDEQIWLTRFLVVRACGYLEQVVHETVVGHLRERSGGTAQAFALSWLERSRTPSPDNLATLVGRLDGNLRVRFEELLDGDDRRLSLQLHLLIARRHQIAHGLNEGLDTNKALELVETVHALSDWFIRELNPAPLGRSR